MHCSTDGCDCCSINIEKIYSISQSTNTLCKEIFFYLSHVDFLSKSCLCARFFAAAAAAEEFENKVLFFGDFLYIFKKALSSSSNSSKDASFIFFNSFKKKDQKRRKRKRSSRVCFYFLPKKIKQKNLSL